MKLNQLMVSYLAIISNNIRSQSMVSLNPINNSSLLKEESHLSNSKVLFNCRIAAKQVSEQLMVEVVLNLSRLSLKSISS